MKVGDLVRVKSDPGGTNPQTGGFTVWHQFMGQVGVIVAEARRLHIPAFKVMLSDEVLEFDHDELERIVK